MRWIVLAVAALAAGCAGTSGPIPEEPPPIENPRDVRVLWSTSVGRADRFTFFPALVDDAVYATSREGTVTRLDAARGNQRWQVELELAVSGGVGADARTVAVVSEEGEVVALEPQTGKVRWRARASSEVLGPPAIGSGLVLVRSIDNRVFAFGADDGKRRWVYQRAPSSLVVRAPANIVLDATVAYVGFPGGKLAALALENGALRWEATVATPKGATELERVTDVIGTPALLGREVCAAAYRGRVGCYDAASGRQLWTRELLAFTGVAVDARYLYVVDENATLHALDRSSGTPVWKQDKLAYRSLSPALAAGDTVVVGDFEGYIHFLARDSGDFVARHMTYGGAVRVAPLPLAAGQRAGLLVLTEEGDLVALAL